MNFTPAPSIAFSKAKKTSNKIVSRPLVIIYHKNNYNNIANDTHFMGITISKKSIKKAVVRNKIKRRIRVIFKKFILENSLPKITIIFIVRAQILNFSFATLQSEIIKNLKLIESKLNKSCING
jgi:ribonuclease P protein component